MLIHSDSPAVILDARTCLWLEQYAKLTTLRVEVRGTNPEISKALEEIRTVAMSARWLRNQRDESAQPAPESEWMSTTQAADVAGVTDAAIRKAIKQDRLPATRNDRGWQINRQDLEQYRAAKPA